MSRDHTVLVWCTVYNLSTFTWIVHFELPFRLKGTDKIQTEGLFKFLSIIICVLCFYYLRRYLLCKNLFVEKRLCNLLPLIDVLKSNIDSSTNIWCSDIGDNNKGLLGRLKNVRCLFGSVNYKSMRTANS